MKELADDLPERATEGPQAVEADVEADVGDAAVGLAQQEHRALHTPPLQVTMRRLPEDGAEGADEVRLGDIGHRGHGADVERLGVGAVHGVAGAQQAPVQVLDFSAHGATLRRQGRILYPTRGVFHYPKRVHSSRSYRRVRYPARRAESGPHPLPAATVHPADDSGSSLNTGWFGAISSQSAMGASGSTRKARRVIGSIAT